MYRHQSEAPMDEIRKMLDQNTAVRLWPEAGKALNLKRGAAYAAAGRGEIRTLRFGRLLKVPTAWLRSQLGLDDAKAPGT
jgi:hypothetical protein